MRALRFVFACALLMASNASASAASTAAAAAAVLHNSASISTVGSSSSTVAGQSVAVKSFLAFTGHTAFEVVPAEELCAEAMYAKFAHFLVHRDKPLKLSTIEEYVRKLFGLAKDKYGKDAAWSPFFLSAQPGDSNSWLNRLLRNVQRTMMQQAVEDGSELKSQATPIGHELLALVSGTLARHGTLESIKRKLMINFVFCACGRAGEVATLCWNLLTYDYQFKAPVFVWSELKTSKQKHVLLLPSEHRLLCMYKHFGDAFIAGVFQGVKSQLGATTANEFLFPEYTSGSRSSSVSSALTSWLKQLTVASSNNNQTYAQHRVVELPPDVSASGLRMGAINALAPYMLDSQIVTASGHDLTGVSAVHEYINVTTPDHVPRELLHPQRGGLLLCV